MKNLRKKFPILFFSIAVTLVFSIILLIPNYRHYPIEGLKDLLFVGVHFFVSAFGLYCIVLILSLNRVVFLVLLPIFILLSSATAFFTWQYDVSINSALLESFLATNIEEVTSYFTFALLAYLLFSLGLGALFIYFRFRIRWNKKEVKIAIVLFLISFLSVWYVNQYRYNTILVRSPFSYYLAAKDLKKEHGEIKKDRLMLGQDSFSNSDTLTVVFLLGEALRADHIQMNGYNRITMPNMEKKDVISMPEIFSPYTHTAQSLPYILTRASNSNLNSQFTESSFIDILKTSGFSAAWIGNQNPTRTYRFFVNECDTVFINKPQFSDYSNIKKLDSDLIDPVKKIIKKAETKQFIVVHLAGNHWWYNSRFPDSAAVFKPILKNKTISPSNKEQMINSYDNATLFSDYVLNDILNLLENRNALVIFLSDHGQSFGEEGKWLHANNTDAEKNPACFVWMSDSYKRKYPEKLENLKLNQYKKTNTSFLFHTILDGSLITSPYLELHQSLFSFEFQPEQGNIDSIAE
jgi:glucan phosphoethanolaminetransferase (alkaline phosphatase superfamily)